MDIITTPTVPMKRDRIGRKIYSKEQRQYFLELFHASGLSQAEFSRRNQIHWTTLQSWLTQQRKTISNSAGCQKKMSFTEVKVTEYTSTFSELLRAKIICSESVSCSVDFSSTEQLVAFIKQMQAKSC